jgi:glycosyltransferase involved in cell wall biosynthesis
MKVLHCCLAAFYIDDFGYQENILPRIHKQQGHEVEIIASTETYVDRVKRAHVASGSYVSTDGIRVTRLPYVRWLPAAVGRKLRLYVGLKHVLQRFAPDLIFLHDCQFLDIGIVADYARVHGTQVYVDCHTDFINSGRTWLSRHVLHGLIYRACALRIASVTHKFFATLPVRSTFLQQVYGIPREQIELLPFGVDDTAIVNECRESVRGSVRREIGLVAEQVVFVTGGKIDRRKEIHTLLASFIERSDAGELGDAVLIVFGAPDQDMKGSIDAAKSHPRVRYAGWVAAEKVHRYLWAADVALFPGTHSVLWEEAVGLGLPCVFRRWEGIEHVDLDGNCLMLDKVDAESLGTTLRKLCDDAVLRERMRVVAATRGTEMFSYSRIARIALGLDALGP